jgi:SepF-like predicted cell division protein (DUF552 family)
MATVFVAAAFVRAGIRTGRSQSHIFASHGRQRPKATVGELDGILDNIVALNSQYLRQDADPAVHLTSALRLSAADFTSSALEIGRSVRTGNVTIVEFAQLELHEARRLAYFCSGLACHSAAWIFRLSDTVLIITPPSRASTSR